MASKQHRTKSRPNSHLPPAAAQAKLDQAVALHQRSALGAAAALYSEILAAYPRQADCLHLLGVVSYQSGDFARATDLIGKAIAVRPDDASFHSNLGLALNDLKQPAAALASFDRAIALKPDYAEAHLNRGNTLQKLGRFADAVAGYDCAIALRPSNPDAFNNRGIALRELGDWQASIASHDKAIALHPNYAEAYSNRGIALRELNQPADALASYDRAILLKPGYAEAHYNRGNLLKALGRFDDAIAAFDRAIQLRPGHADSHYNRGNTLNETQQWQAAIESFEQAIALCPEHVDALTNQGLALKMLNRMAAAIACYDRASALAPYDPQVANNLGTALQAANATDAALLCHDRAIALKPDFANAHWNKALALLLAGDFDRGWPLYEWRWRVESLSTPERSFSQPLWLGDQPLAGRTILLHAEQGIGDTLQFCRYARLVANAGARVVLEVQPPLLSLLRDLDGVFSLIAAGSPLPSFDFHCPLLSLPRAFRTLLDTIPATPHLRGDAAKLRLWSERLGTPSSPRIGLVWSGASAHENDHNRSIPLSLLLPHLPDNCQYFSLQKEVRDSDLPALRDHPAIRHLGGQIEDFSDTAALCLLMDGIVSVDTSVAHLAATLGRPTSVLLPFHPDWRWLLGRSDSPWYPSALLLRQHAPGDWSHPLDLLRQQLTGAERPQGTQSVR